MRLGKGGGGGEKNVSPHPPRARFSHFFLLNDFSPLSRSLEQANTLLDMKTIYIVRASGHIEEQSKEHFFVRDLTSGATPVPHFLF